MVGPGAFDEEEAGASTERSLVGERGSLLLLARPPSGGSGLEGRGGRRFEEDEKLRIGPALSGKGGGGRWCCPAVKRRLPRVLEVVVSCIVELARRLGVLADANAERLFAVGRRLRSKDTARMGERPFPSSPPLKHPPPPLEVLLFLFPSSPSDSTLCTLK